MKSVIEKTMREIAEQQGLTIQTPLSDDTVLLQSGLDSLGFAILVTILEERLGYDPFIQMTHALYPRTFGEFVKMYSESGLMTKL